MCVSCENENAHCVCVSVCMPLTCVRQAEGPQSEVRCCVGDAAQAVLYGVDGLMHEYVYSVSPLQRVSTVTESHSISIYSATAARILPPPQLLPSPPDEC